MTSASRKREPSVASAIAAMAKAGLVPRLERRPDGSWVLTGVPVQTQSDYDESYRLALLARERKRRDEVQAIQEAQAGIIHHLLWMLRAAPTRRHL